MATYTSNYNLKKPEATDFVDVADLNENSYKIDATLKSKADLSDGKIPVSQIPALNYVPTTRKINGKTLSSDVTLAASDVGAIPASQKGVSGGVASLGSDGKVPITQLPDRLGILPRLDVTAPSGATITVENGPITLTETSNGLTSFDVPNYGTWVVTVTQGDSNMSTVVEVDTVKIYPVMLLSLSDATWEQIATASEMGIAESLWAVGDEKNITVGTETLTLVIKGFNHDNLTGGGKAGITFGLKNLMNNLHNMANNDSNENGFAGSGMYSWLQDTVFQSLPADLRTVIKTVDKRTSVGGGSLSVETESMKLFLFSESEIFGTETHSTGNEGEQYHYFATQQNRIKSRSNGSGSAYRWWGRSPTLGVDSFCCVNANGAPDFDITSNPNGVCFGFCV